ncbi:Mevalonate kinase [Nymphon striatum]|nr:Mevalonate kinase [Nymphon striatum]
MKIKVSAPGKIILSGEHSVVHGKKAVAVALDKRTQICIEDSSSNCIYYKSESLNISERIYLDKLNELNTRLEHGNDNQMLQSIQKFIACSNQLLDSQKSAIVSFLFLYLTLSNIQNRASAPCETTSHPYLIRNDPGSRLDFLNAGVLLHTLLQIVKSLCALTITVTSALPIGAGLGSSASYSVCVAAGLLKAFNVFENNAPQLSFNKRQIEEISLWAYRLETIFHGRPSGIDNTICSYGGAAILQSGQKTLPSKVNKIDILVVNTNISRNTKLMVKHVSDLLKQFPNVIEPVLESMNAIASLFEKSLTSTADYEELKELVKINQQLLCAIGVSHESLDDICRICNHHNLSGKLTGAGGGGCAYVLLPPDIQNEKLDRVKNELESKGYNCILSSVGGKGISLDLFED